MKMPKDWLSENAQLRMFDARAGVSAPLALWACMSSLTAGAEPIAHLVEHRGDNGAAEWRALWLTDSVLAYASVSKAKEGWSSHSDMPGDIQPDTTTGWARPIRSVARVELVSVECKRVESYSESGRTWLWSSSSRVVFDDGHLLDVPLFGESVTDEMDVDAQALVDALVLRLPAHS